MASNQVLEIRLTGSSTVSRLAERGILSVSISSSGTSKPKVSEDVTKVTKDLQALISPLDGKDANTGLPAPDAPVTWWSMSNITTRTWVPSRYDSNTQQHIEGERQYSANSSFTVKFKDFTKLSEIATDLTVQEFVTVNGVTWTLTDATRDALASENRRKAVADAMLKAKDYAGAAIGEHAVVKVVDMEEVNDGGVSDFGIMPQGANARQGGGLFGAHGGGPGGEQESLNLRPQDVDLHTAVNLKFTAQ